MREPLRTFLLATSFVCFGALFGASTAQAQCGDFNDNGIVSATDALGVLQAAIGSLQCDVYHCDVDDSGSITPTDALIVLRWATGQPAQQLNCPIDPTSCQNDMEFFFESVWTPILTDCVSCHNPDGIANFTDHVLLPDSVMGYLGHNFGVLRSLWENGKGDLILTKPQGIGHGGGQRLGITPSSVLYDHLVELLDRFANPVTNCETTESYWVGISHLSEMEVIEKAAILFAGRRPTNAEISDVERSRLATAVRRTMFGDHFESFIREGANDHLLTDKFLNRGTSAFNVLKGDYAYPAIYSRINYIEDLIGREGAELAWQMTNRALAREPLELIVNIATHERSYTEIVTADYIMVNPWSAPVYNTNGSLSSEFDEGTWQPGHNQGYRLPNYPHAGILTSPMFLNRFPSTATNRNRARARWVSRLFLGQDIETLAPRAVDPAALENEDNPTMYNPNCTVCHTVMDPIAGTFQNFGDDGLYLESNSDSLPREYKRTDLYESGDRWYADMRAPGFVSEIMPGSYRDNSLVWLGQQIASDPRFARGAVQFWYEAMFGRPPHSRPLDPTAADYRPRLAAFVAQDEIFTDIANRFRDGTAGTGRNGAHNLRDLLVELTLSPLFTAVGATGSDANRDLALAQLGFVKLLTPEQLNRKFEGTTGYRWARLWDSEEPDLLGRYRIFYGGIDSVGITRRAEELNALMSTVPQRMAYETACPIVVTDFTEPANRRVLFSFVEPEDRPDSPGGETAIRTNIVWLHQRLLGEVLADDDPEVDAAYGLFNQVWQLRISQGKSTNLRSGGGHCEIDWEADDYVTEDPNHTLRAWIAVLAYLLNDYRFIYE
ncbi:MAG: DUF1588 domain-containing protein [Candidatus Binatia bacterium]